jgi:hypothetical protein
VLDVEVRKLASGRSHACAVTSDGRVWCWGDLTSATTAGSTSAADEASESIATIDFGQGEAFDVAVGSDHACVVLVDGSVKCWNVYASGHSEPQQVQGLMDVQQVVIGFVPGQPDAPPRSQACALLTNGSVRCWGLDDVADLSRAEPSQVHGF